MEEGRSGGVKEWRREAKKREGVQEGREEEGREEEEGEERMKWMGSRHWERRRDGERRGVIGAG